MDRNSLKESMKKQPKFLRTIRHNKHPVIMNQSYAVNFEGYKELGIEKLSERAKKIRNDKKFAEKISSILLDEADEKENSKSQEDIYTEESIYKKFSPNEDNILMAKFHEAEWSDRSKIIQNFKDERLKYFGQKILYQEKPESLSKDLYTKIHKDTAKRLLSKNNEKWNTIPRTYSEIDTLRIKYEKEGKNENLTILDEINAYVEDLEKFYSSV